MKNRCAGGAVGNRAGCNFEPLEGRVLLSALPPAGTLAVAITDPTAGDYATVYRGSVGGAIQVEFTDAAAINVSSIKASDLTIAGPTGSIQVTGVNVSPATPGDTSNTDLIASFAILPPNGVWNFQASGNYTATIAAGKITDANGVFAAATSLPFTVSIATSSTPVAFPENGGDFVTVPGTTSLPLTIAYYDDTGIATSTLGNGNLYTLPDNNSPAGGYFSVVYQNDTVSDNGRLVTANYLLEAPHALYAEDDTTYHFLLTGANTNPTGEVTNTAGVPVTSTAGANGDAYAALIEVIIYPNDSSFSGVAATGFLATAIAQQSDGDTILAGYQGDPSSGSAQLELERLSPDGSLDTTFGTNGAVIDPTANTAGYGIAIEPDDSIVVAGTSGGQGAVWHYQSNGALDSSFGNGGVALSVTGIAYSVALGPNGAILIGGRYPYDQWFISSFSASGVLDASFGSDGVAGGLPGTVGTLAWEPDGTIVAAGDDNGVVAVAEFTPTGAPDTADFGNGAGYVSTALDDLSATLGYPDYTIGMAVQSDGKIVVAADDGNGDFATERLNSDGSVDTSFGSSGEVITSFDAGSADADSVSIQSGGQIIVTGNAGSDTAVAAYNSDGSSDAALQGGNSNGPPQATGTYAFAPSFGITAQFGEIGGSFFGAFGFSQGNNVTVETREETSSTTGSVPNRIIVPGIETVLGSAPNVTAAGDSPYTFTVDYFGSANLNNSSIATSNVTVTGPAGALDVTNATGSFGASDSVLDVTYTVAPPAGGWTAADDGPYDIALPGRSAAGVRISDVHGDDAAGSVIGSFQINVGGTSTTSGTTTTTVTGDLTPTLSGNLPPSVIAGQKANLSQKVTLSNTSGSAYDAAASVSFFLSATSTLSGAISLPTSFSKTVKLKVGKAESFKLSLKSLPASVPDGTYHVLAEAIDSNGNTSLAASTGTITVAPPVVNLSVALSKFTSSAALGGKFKETITVSNSGNIAAAGALPIVVDLSPDGLLSDATQLAELSKNINLKPGRSISIPLTLVAPATAGSDYLVVQIDPENALHSESLTSEVVVSPVKITFS